MKQKRMRLPLFIKLPFPLHYMSEIFTFLL
uniref:Uncharacterized protein n=1 Tax=virus sp. ct5rm7 TaxID=2827298 RepID=A0A8S5RFU4_9VIRU|nr:MAG TPA: hypothetical protein [virus sp. ct5rm7]